MVGKRLGLLICLLGVLLLGILWAYSASRLVPDTAVEATYWAFSNANAAVRGLGGETELGLSGGHTYNLLFKSTMWLVLIAPFLGIFVGSLRKEHYNPETAPGQVMRHETTGTYLEHWATAVGVTTMLVTAVLLGSPLIIKRLVHTPEAVGFAFNVHFLGVIFMLFGVFLHVTNQFLAGRLGRILFEPPNGQMYSTGQRTAYRIWAIIMLGLVLTGGVKVTTYIVSLPPSIMGVMNLVYQVVLLAGVIFLPIHVLLELVSWPRFVAMFTGFIPEDYAKRNFPEFLRQTQKGI